MDEIFGDFKFDPDNEGINRAVETHPLTVFGRLLASDPGSKLYRQCLDNEIGEVAKSIAPYVTEVQMLFVEHMLSKVPDVEPSAVDDMETREIIVRTGVIRRIFAEVRRLHEVCEK